MKRKWLSGSRSFSAGLSYCVEYFFIFIFFPFFFVLGVGDKDVSLKENVLRLAVESYADNQTDNISKLLRTAERYSQAATFFDRIERSIKVASTFREKQSFCVFAERERAFSLLRWFHIVLK